ncbi:MAG TPA: serine hydrolase domain-containing protein [Sphingomicrobium sp.]|nr:serine hydrolase domain-containing protein [Sphingomicrobium sp.]
MMSPIRSLARLVAVAALGLAGCTTIRLPPPPIAQAGIAFGRSGEVGAFAEGLADPSSGRQVTPDDPVRIASISKTVVAIGVMKLVEQGRLDLNSDVSAWLGWSLRNPAFPDRPITLRQLLSHTSSIRDHDDQYAIPLGGTVRQVMAQPTSWTFGHGPGENYFSYSNMNFPIIASVIERVTGERFDIWMRANILDPMKIDACFNWPTCSDWAIARAVQLTSPNGAPIRDDLDGRRPDCPVYVTEGQCDLSRWSPGENGALFAPQGGLRISARGLARVGRLLLGGGTLDGVAILTPASVETLLAPVWRYDGNNGDSDGGFYCTYGLATHRIPTAVRGCDDNPIDDGPIDDGPIGDGIVRVGHAGDAYGLRSGLWLDRASGTGVAYFLTGLGENPPRGRSAFAAAEQLAFSRALSLLRN